MRIVVFTTWFPSARNPGAGSFVARDVRQLALGHDVEVWHLAPPELDDGIARPEGFGVSVRRVSIDVRRPLQLVRAMRIVRHAVRDADVVHTMAAPALLPFILWRPRVPWVHTEHWSGIVRIAAGGGVRGRLMLGVYRRLLSGPDRVVAVSDHLATAIRKLRRGPVAVVGNIVDPATAAAASGRAPDGIVRVVAIGNVIEHKGWSLAVEAVRLLRARGIDARLTWLGSGPDLEQLRATGADIAVDAPGQVDRAAVADALASADVMVLPTRAETFSLVTVEALQAGVPVVVTGNGAHTDFVTADSGVVVARVASSIADGVEQAAKLDRALVAARGAELATSFSPGEFSRRYDEIYTQVTKGRN